MTGRISVTLNEPAVRKAITPMVDDFIVGLRVSALKRGEEGQAIRKRSEARFRNRLDAFAGEQGIFGQHRTSMNLIVDTILNQRATATLAMINQESGAPQRTRLSWGGWLKASLGPEFGRRMPWSASAEPAS